MRIDLGFVLRVRRLHRQVLGGEAIARELRADLVLVSEAHRMLDLPLRDRDPELPSARAMTDAELDRIPKRIADRIRKSQQGE